MRAPPESFSLHRESQVGLFETVGSIDYDQRGEYILYYDAKDSSLNSGYELGTSN